MVNLRFRQAEIRAADPIVGTIIYLCLREFLADLGSIYLIILGAVGIAMMLLAPKGLWGYVADRFGWQVFPLSRRLIALFALGPDGGECCRARAD